MKFLIDQNLTPDLVDMVRRLGHEAVHAFHIGWSSTARTRGGGGSARSAETEGAACAAGGWLNKETLLPARSACFARGPFRLALTRDPPSPQAGKDVPPGLAAV